MFLLVSGYLRADLPLFQMERDSHPMIYLPVGQQWNDNIMLKAITAVIEGSSVRKAVRHFEVMTGFKVKSFMGLTVDEVNIFRMKKS